MIALVIFMSLSTIGKLRGQLATVPGAINVRISSPFPLSPRTFMVPEQGRLVQQDIPRQNSVQQSSTDRSEASYTNGNLNLRPLTLESRPNQRLFIPERSPDRTDRRDGNVAKIVYTSNIDQISTPLKNQAIMDTNGGNRSSLVKQNGTSFTKPITTTKPEDPLLRVTQNEASVDRPSSNGNQEMGATGKPTPPTIVDEATGVEVTLDERASFDGDKCPTGYVRINGMCVEKD